MSTELFNKNIDKLEKNLFKVELDISSYLLPDKEVVKNIIRSKNPNMSVEDINLMTHGPGYKPPTNVEGQSIGEPQTPTELPTSAEYSPYPLPESHHFYSEAKDVKNSVKRSTSMVAGHKKELMNNIINCTTLLTTSIPGIAIMMGAVPWNVPGALSLASTVLNSLNDLTSKTVKVLNNLQPLKKLDLVTSKNSQKKLLAILNPIIMTLNAILDPISKIKKFLSTLIDKIKELLGGGPKSICKKSIKTIKKQIVRKEVEKVLALSKFQKKNAEELQEDIDDLKERLDDVVERCGKKTGLEQDMEELSTMAQNIATESDTWIESLKSTVVYDVELPDGTVLLNLNDDDIKALSGDFNLIFK